MLVLLVLGGCTEPNYVVPRGVLEVELTLPPAPAPELGAFASIQFRPDRLLASLEDQKFPFDSRWIDTDDLPGIPLAPGEDLVEHISVMAEEVDTDLRIKVRFCASRDCTDPLDDAAPEVWFALERPLYGGATTYWSARITEGQAVVAPAPIDVSKCDIEGCQGMRPSPYCDERRQHYCDTPMTWQVDPRPAPMSDLHFSLESVASD